MKYALIFFITLVINFMESPSLLAQDEEATKSDAKVNEKDKAPVADEFSIIMRNLMNRAKAGHKINTTKEPTSKLVTKVDDIQAILNKSDEQVAKASQIKSALAVSGSETLEDKEVEMLKAQIEKDKKEHVNQLKMTKAKIAEAKQKIHDKKKHLALEKANKAVENALKLLEKENE